MIALALSAALLAATPPPTIPAAPPRDLVPFADVEPAGPDGDSVYRIGRADYALTGLAIAGSILPHQWTRQLIRRTCPCEPEEVNAFDRAAVDMNDKMAGAASDVTVALALTLPVVADVVNLGFGQAFKEDLVVYVETLALNGAIVTGVKYLVQRPLPATVAGREGLEAQAQGYRSFYSGHTSTAVAALTAAAWTHHLRHGPSAWPWIVTGVVGTSVAVERVLAGRHWPTDVLVGAAAGFGIGTLVPLLHARKPPWKRGTVSVVPQGRGLAVVGKF